MHYVKKSLSCALLIIIMVIGFALAGTIQVSAEAPGVIVIISSDTTWTKADSPHILTGPVFVSNGVTLTIEAGATVDVNGYYILVNGTFVAVGTSSERIHVTNGERLEFTQFSDEWDEQTGSGCVIEEADISFPLYSSVSLKLITCSLSSSLTVGDSSKIVNCEIGGIVEAGSSTIISDSHIHTLNAFESTVITNNIVEGKVTVGDSSQILNNIIKGTVEVSGDGGSPVISNNTITPPSSVIYPDHPLISYIKWHPGIILEGTNNGAIISNNTLSGCSSGIKLDNLVGSVTIERNVICDNIDDGISVVADINLTIVGNFIHNNTDNGIKDYWGKANMVIRNNTITDNSHGITDPGPALIERNLIADNNVGLDLASQATVQNNTITNNDVAIRLKYCPSAKINYNNIENYGENSIYLINTLGNVDATNNWWGTTDTQAINLTIHDYKYDLGLSKVNFTPFLTEPNTEATSDPIPEFPSWLLLPLFLVATFVVIVVRKRLVG